MDIPLIPRQVLFGDPERTQARISPDGRYVAFLAPHEGVLNIWVRDLITGQERPVSFDKGRGIHTYMWVLDGTMLIYPQDKDGDENWRLFGVSMDDLTVVPFTPPGVQAQLVASYKRIPDRIIVALNQRQESCHDVFRLTLPKGELKMVAQNDGSIVGWVADGKLRVRLAHRVLPGARSCLLHRDNERSPWCTVRQWEAEDNFSRAAGFAPDQRCIYVVESKGANSRRLVQFNPFSGQFNVLVEDPLYDVADLFLDPQDGRVLAAAVLRERMQWEVIEESVREDFEVLTGAGHGDLAMISTDRTGLRWTVAYDADVYPVRYFLYDRGRKRLQFLFSSRPELEKYTLSPVRPISFTARDGLEIHGYVTVPAGHKGGALPMVINVHGGPWYRDIWGYDPEAQWLANRGYVCLQINYRGSLGYGKKFDNAGDREWGGKIHQDILDGLAWAVKEQIADPKRVAIYGWSFGGYAALVGASFTPQHFCCAISACGPSNLVTFLKTLPPYWEPLRAIMDRRIGNPERDREFLWQRSPLARAENISIPLLVAQGANDPRVRKEESDMIVEAARRAGKDVKYLVFKDEGHGLYRPQNRLKFYAEAEKFLARHLGGRYEQ